jgi:hypothetical protein
MNAEVAGEILDFARQPEHLFRYAGTYVGISVVVLILTGITRRREGVPIYLL